MSVWTWLGVVILILCGVVAFGLIASGIYFELRGLDIDALRPWSILIEIRSHGHDAAHQHDLAIAAGVPAIMLVIIMLAALRRPPMPIFGDARWATRSELKRAGVRDRNGLLLGRKDGRYLCSDTATHTLLCGPTRAGKGTGMVIPNCLNWPGSLVVLDVKGENHKITSGYRAGRGQSVFFWAPMSPNAQTHRYNPLDLVRADPDHRISDVQLIASLLIDVSDRDPIWGQEARSLFVAATLFVLDTADIKTLGEVYRFIACERDLQEVCFEVLDERDDLSPQIRRGLGAFAAKAPKEASSVRSTLAAALRLFENPIIDAATSASDFDVAALRAKPMSIYVGALAPQLDVLAPLLRLFFQQVMAVLSSKEPSPNEPYKVLLLLDEFASLGRMDAVVSAFTLLAGYNVRVLAVIQGLTWLDRVYGRDTREGIISCCGLQIFMTSNDEATSNYVSQSLGHRTVEVTSTTKRSDLWNTSPPSKNTSQTGRPLMSGQQVRTLAKDKQIILIEGQRPVLASKIRYFQQTAFKARLRVPALVPSLNIFPHGRIVTDTASGLRGSRPANAKGAFAQLLEEELGKL